LLNKFHFKGYLDVIFKGVLQNVRSQEQNNVEGFQNCTQINNFHKDLNKSLDRNRDAFQATSQNLQSHFFS